MDEISHEMHRDDEIKYSSPHKSRRGDQKQPNYDQYNQAIDNSREILMSDDMKRNLKHVMEENSEDDQDEDDYEQKDNEPEFDQKSAGRRDSFGNEQNQETDRFGISSTPKMGENYAEQQDDQEENKDNENHNPYPDSSSRTEHPDNEIGLNLSKVELGNKNFSDLVTNGKVNREVLMDKIKKNQAMYDEHSESLKHCGVNDSSSNSQILAGVGKQGNDSQYEDPNAFSNNLKDLQTNEMHSKQLVNELLFKSGSKIRRNDKVNNSCVVSKSHAHFDGRSPDYYSSREISNFPPALELLIEKLSALEADIARNFKVISSKFTSFNNENNKMKFELESNADYMNSFESKLESFERRMNCFSERDDKIFKMSENLTQKLHKHSKDISDIEGKIHDLELNRMAEEKSRVEIMNSSLPMSMEVENLITKLEERSQNLENRLMKNEEKTRRLESQSHRENEEAVFQRRCDQMENDLREELDKILEQVDSAKNDIKAEISEDFVHYEQIGALEKHMKHLKINSNSMNNRIDQLEKEMEHGSLNNELQEDLRQLKDLSYSITKINNTYKDDVFKLENQIKENSMKIMNFENVCAGLKSEVDQKLSKSNYDLKAQGDKVEYLEGLFNEMYEVIKKHNMQEKVSNMQQINHSMMYNVKDSRADLSASGMSKNTE